MTNATLRRAAAGSILSLACLGAVGPVAVAGPAAAAHAATSPAPAVSSTTAASLAYGITDCRRAASTTTSMRLKVLYALADPGCRQTMERWAGIAIHDGGAFAQRICVRSQQPDGFLYRWLVYVISGGMAFTCTP